MKPALSAALLSTVLCACSTSAVTTWTLLDENGDALPEHTYEVQEVVPGRKYSLTCPVIDMGFAYCDDYSREACGRAYRVLRVDEVRRSGDAIVYGLDIECVDTEDEA